MNEAWSLVAQGGVGAVLLVVLWMITHSGELRTRHEMDAWEKRTVRAEQQVDKLIPAVEALTDQMRDTTRITGDTMRITGDVMAAQRETALTVQEVAGIQREQLQVMRQLLEGQRQGGLRAGRNEARQTASEDRDQRTF
jgi:hypothetical protein